MQARSDEFRRCDTRCRVMLEACWFCPHGGKLGRHDCASDSIPTLFEIRFTRRAGVIRRPETASVHIRQMGEIQEVLMQAYVVSR